MAKNDPQIDVLVVGGHPSAYLAAALLKEKSKLRVVHATIPKETLGDRLVLVNPELFDLHPILSPLRRKLAGNAIYGLRFLADDAATASEYRIKSAVASVAQLKDIVTAMKKLAEAQDVEFCNPKQLEIRRLDEQGLQVTVGNQELRPKAMVLAGALSEGQQKMLGLPEEWERGILRRYSYVRLKNVKGVDFGNRPLMPMSLDLAGRLSWAWLLPGEGQIQLAIEQPIESVAEFEPSKLLNHWAGVLHSHGVLPKPLTINQSMVESLDLPLGGALSQEGVANRTLLIGPAGGFYSASGEDVYPNCWSAIFAAEVLKKSLREKHLQDAIQAYRQRWRTTLGDYLRGPQQNLRFLLPLVYRNQVMTNRLAEAILTGKSVVR